MRNLPSTLSLKVFEAAARHGSASVAARELCLSQSAVSKQIKALEDQLGVGLFLRTNRGLVLTENGRGYLEEVTAVLEKLSAAGTRLRERRAEREVLTLRMLAAFGDRWLLPRLPGFLSRHPDVEVQFTTPVEVNPRAADRADAEFRYGPGGWTDAVADYLVGREAVLIAAPHLLSREGGLAHPDRIGRFKLLQSYLGRLTWENFFAETGIAPPEQPRIIRCDFHSTLIAAALSGAGLALLPRCLVERELADGILVNPLGLSFQGAWGYHLAFPGQQSPTPALAAFREWILAQAQAAT